MSNIILKPHQKEALKKMRSGSILCGGVGSGKSLVSLFYFLNIDYKKNPKHNNLYIITTAKQRDDFHWVDECVRIGGKVKDKKVTFYDKINVYIDSWNNIQKYSNITNAFFIFDEQRVVGHGAWSKSFIKIARNNNWILLSATPGDNWMDYISVFVANGFYRNRTQFINRHVVYDRYIKYKPKDFLEKKHLERLRDSILVEMPDERKTIRHEKYIYTDYDKKLFNIIKKDRWNPFDDKPIENSAEYCRLMRKVVNNSNKIQTILELLKKHKKLIIFYNFNYELDMLRNIKDIIIAEWNGQKHEKIPNTDTWLYLVQYSAGAEGWNCISTNAIYFFSLNYSYKIMEQARGRIDRLTTPFTDLYYYYGITNSLIDLMIIKALKNKKKFNEKAFAIKKFNS